MLNKKDFLKYASTLAFPIMLQNLIGTLVNIADTVMLGYVSRHGSLAHVSKHYRVCNVYQRSDQILEHNRKC